MKNDNCASKSEEQFRLNFQLTFFLFLLAIEQDVGLHHFDCRPDFWL
jgi:hypothetical protein